MEILLFRLETVDLCCISFTLIHISKYRSALKYIQPLITSYHLLFDHPGISHSQLLIWLYNGLLTGFSAFTLPAISSPVNRAA